MRYDICCIGHITHDRIITPQATAELPGGVTFYFSHGISHLLHEGDNLSYRLIASLGVADMKAVDDIRARGIEVDVVPSRETVFFENKYGDNVNERTQRVLAKADPFTVEALKDVEAQYIVLGTLLADDFSLDVVKSLSSRGTLVVDAQGYLREVRGDKVFPCDWSDKKEFLKYIDILKVNEHEVRDISGETDLLAGARKLLEWGVKEVLLTLGSLGSYVVTRDETIEIPAFAPREVVDATGCGDTYVMSYLYKRVQGCGKKEAATFAAAVSTIKLEHSGPFTGTEAEALARI
ncbi:MAG: ribokinase [Bacteroidales bacterium]|nr:ribokinase [Candidatus Sodaliphilus fimicaballi]